MRRFREIGSILFITVVALVACDSANNSTALENDSRVRLSVNKPSAQSGPYVIQVSAMSTAELTPEIAQAYGIVRSPNQGLVNLVVLRQEGGSMEEPIGGNVTVSAANLTGQLKNIELREIDALGDDASIYYIGLISVEDRETINFDFDVQPEGSNQLLLIRYTHQFYTK